MNALILVLGILGGAALLFRRPQQPIIYIPINETRPETTGCFPLILLVIAILIVLTLAH